MKYKTLYAAHEVRMWVGTIISGIATAAAIVATNPEIKEAAKEKWGRIKDKFKKRPKIKIVVVNDNEDAQK